MRNAAFTSTANAIINSVREELTGEREKVFERIDATQTSILNALTATSGSSSDSGDNDPPTPPTETAKETTNATTQDTVQLKILKLLKTMHSELKKCSDDGDNSNRRGKK